MSDALMAFAGTGSPNAEDRVQFPAWESGTLKYANIGEKITAEEVSGPKLEFWRKYYKLW